MAMIVVLQLYSLEPPILVLKMFDSFRITNMNVNLFCVYAIGRSNKLIQWLGRYLLCVELLLKLA